MPFCASFQDLNEKVTHCRLCPRLVEFRESVPKRAAFKDEPYWRRPVPGFGDPKGWLLILGLAPAAHGGNRTGRLFTGDESARFLMRCLHAEGFANQPTSTSKDDGLQLIDCYMTAAVKCVPPKNLPTPDEFYRCSGYLENEIALLKNLKAVLALGKGAFDTYIRFLRNQGVPKPYPTFSYGAKGDFTGWPSLYGCYHPSPQNTYTGKLTDEMFRKILQRIKNEQAC